MRKVLYSLIPIYLFAVWLFGLRVLSVLCVVLLAGVVTEFLIMRYANGSTAKISEAVYVSCALYALTLPPTIPYWVAAVGIIFGVLFGKGVFGGFGRNIFNPALVGRCFVYISFPVYMTVSWAQPFGGLPGGFLKWSTATDAITSATPMSLFESGEKVTSYLNLFLGNISGSTGETSALLIILAGVYLVFTKTASWKIMVSCFSSFFLINSIFYFAGLTKMDPLFAILSGGFLFAVVFMTTDPISAPSEEISKIIYGILIGLLAFVIRTYSIFNEGIMFAILLGNMFGPMIEKNVKEFKARKKVVA